MNSQKVGGDTAVVMGEILKARADAMAINITLNSFGTPLNEVCVWLGFTNRILAAQVASGTDMASERAL